MTIAHRRAIQLPQLLGATIVLGVGACGVSADRVAEVSAVARHGDALTVAETILGTDPPVPLQYHTGGYLSVANDGTNSLVVFYDGGEIRGMRYDAQGQLLDLEQWLRLGRNDDAGAHAYTDLAYGNGVYMALFTDNTEGARGVDVQPVAPSGEILGPPTLAGAEAYYGAVVFNGTDFTVAWSDGDIHLVRVGLDGESVAGTEVEVTTTGGTNRPVLAMAGDTGLVAFEQEVDGARKVYAARFDAEGHVLDPEGFLVSDETTSSVNLAAAAGGEEFAVIWSAGDSVYGTIVSESGSVLSLERPISRAGSAVGGSTVAHDGSQYLVAWQHNESGGDSAIMGTRMAGDGTLLDDEPVPLASPSRAGQSWDMDLAWGDGRYHLNFIHDGVEGRFLDSELSVLDPGPLQLSALPNPQSAPAAAWDGQAYVLGWIDERDQDASQLRAGRIDDSGALLDPDGLVVSPPDERVGGLGVASNGQSTLFTWQTWGGEQPTLYQRSLSADGQLSEPEPWLVGMDGGGQVSSNGQTYLALFTQTGDGSENTDEIWGQVFDGNGQKEGDASLLVTISRPRYGLWRFADEYVLAYSGQERAGVAITGSVLTLDGAGEVTAEYGPVLEGMLTASVASSDEHVLFSWQDAADELWGRLLSRGDGWGEPFVLSDQATTGTAALAWDGSAFVAVWPEARTAMWSRRISNEGAMTEPERLFTGDYGWVRLTPGPEGQMLLSYVRWLEWSRSRRIESRIVGALGEGEFTEPVVSPGDTTDPEQESSGSEDLPEAPTPDTETDSDTTTDGAPHPTETSDTSTADTHGATGDSSALPSETTADGDPRGTSRDASCALQPPRRGTAGSAWLLGALTVPLLTRWRRRRSGRAPTSLPQRTGAPTGLQA